MKKSKKCYQDLSMYKVISHKENEDLIYAMTRSENEKVLELTDGNYLKNDDVDDEYFVKVFPFVKAGEENGTEIIEVAKDETTLAVNKIRWVVIDMNG